MTQFPIPAREDLSHSVEKDKRDLESRMDRFIADRVQGIEAQTMTVEEMIARYGEWK